MTFLKVCDVRQAGQAAVLSPSGQAGDRLTENAEKRPARCVERAFQSERRMTLTMTQWPRGDTESNDLQALLTNSAGNRRWLRVRSPPRGWHPVGQRRATRKRRQDQVDGTAAQSELKVLDTMWMARNRTFRDITAADRLNLARGKLQQSAYGVLIFPSKWESACASQLRIRVGSVMWCPACRTGRQEGVPSWFRRQVSSRSYLRPSA
jgi:hypothetical protein